MTASFYPATISRVTQQQSLTRLLFQVNADGAAIQNLQQQLSTGRRVTKPSEDPAAAIRALAAQRAQEFKGQVLNNLKSTDTILAASESTLSQAQDILNEMRGVAIETAGNTLSDSERDANATIVETAISKLVGIANTKFRDQYLFSGSKVSQAPLTYQGNAVKFSGTDDALQSISDYNATIAANVTAEDAFGVRSDEVIGTVELNPALSLTDKLSILNGGEGVRRGAIAVRDGNNAIEIDLSSAHTVGDVVEAFQASTIGGRALTASITPTGLRIEYADNLGGQLGIAEVGSGQVAEDLGIITSTVLSNSPIIGTDLQPTLTRLTSVSSLFGGLGLPNNETLQISQNNRTYLVNTSGLSTVEDFLNRIERSGARVKATVDSSTNTLAIQSVESGTKLSIGEAGGTVASLLGLRTMDLSTPVSQLNSGRGIFTSDTTTDLTITRTDGSQLVIDLDGVQTVGDVLARINTNVGNFNPSLRVTASLATNGNGIVLKAPLGAAPISIASSGGSQAAEGLGLIPKGQTSVTGQDVGTDSVIGGGDVSGIEVEGTFNTLLRLASAIRSSDLEAMQRITADLDVDIQRLSSSRAIVGARQQALSELEIRTEEQNVQLAAEESEEIDADLASVISSLTSRQAAFQASLQLMGNASRLTLFDYL